MIEEFVEYIDKKRYKIHLDDFASMKDFNLYILIKVGGPERFGSSETTFIQM